MASDERAESSFMERSAVDEAMKANQAQSTVGRRVGRYAVLSLLGAGGMGEVYLARDLRLGRRVALKLLNPEVVKDRDRLRRFEQEAIAASSLNHPNIITVYEVDEHEGAPFIAAEVVEGVTHKRNCSGRLRSSP